MSWKSLRRDNRSNPIGRISTYYSPLSDYGDVYALWGFWYGKCLFFNVGG